MSKSKTRRRMSAPNPKKIKFKYVIPKEAPDLHANGVFGGVTPRNEVHMHFYSERSPIPNSVTYTREKEDSEFIESGVDVGGDVVRIIQSSIIMDKTATINLYHWLKELLENMDEEDTK